jgi:hypothetical protein
MVNISQATNNLTTVPVNYAIDLSPALLFDNHNLSADKFIDNKVKHNFWQSLIVSFGINKSDISIDTATIKNTALGLGLKFSILRGNVSKKSQRHINKSLELARKANHKHAEVVSRLQKQSVEWNKLQEMLDSDSLTDSDIQFLSLQGQSILERIHTIAKSEQKDHQKEFRDITSNIDMTRTGFKLDLNAAVSFEFPDQIYSNGYRDKIAVWLTGSQDWENGLSLLGIARYLYNPDEAFLDSLNIPNTDDLSIFNAGIKLQFKKKKFSISGEYIAQHVFNNSDIESGYKFLINAQYELEKNLVLTLNFGRDFNNHFTDDGNVISALNFIKGFGSKRTLSNDIKDDINF